MNLIPIQVLKISISPEQIREQINLRRTLIANMVGTLYPQIMEREMQELRERLSELNGPRTDFSI